MYSIEKKNYYILPKVIVVMKNIQIYNGCDIKRITQVFLLFYIIFQNSIRKIVVLITENKCYIFILFYFFNHVFIIQVHYFTGNFSV